MHTSSLLLLILGLAFFSYFFGRRKAYSVANSGGGIKSLHSLPTHYGSLVALWCAVPAIVLVAFWLMFRQPVMQEIIISGLPEEVQQQDDASRNLFANDIRNLVSSGQLDTIEDPVRKAAAEKLSAMETGSRWLLTLLALALVAAGIFYSVKLIRPETRARISVEKFIRFLLICSASIAILTTVGIVMSVLFESIRFFQQVSFVEFTTGLQWSPMTAIRSDQVGSSGSFGAIPLFTGTLLISLIALIVAVPLGLMSAIYLAEYASSRVRSIVKPLLEILAGIPTVVYGFFAALTVAPAIRGFGESIGLSVASESALAAGTVMGIMIIPFVSSLSDDVITAVPQAMRDGSYGLGATQSETIRKVVLPSALPGIVSSVLLAASRAIGETMIVVMAAGLAANLTANPLEAVTTVTVQIVTLLTGDQEFDSAKTLAAFALGLMLFVTTLILNVIALSVVRRYREQYE